MLLYFHIRSKGDKSWLNGILSSTSNDWKKMKSRTKALNQAADKQFEL